HRAARFWPDDRRSGPRAARVAIRSIRHGTARREVAGRTVAAPRRGEDLLLDRRAVAVSLVFESAATMPGPRQDVAEPIGADPESRAWLRRLRAGGPGAGRAIGERRELLLRAARFEVHRRRAALPHLRGDDYDDLAEHSAD